MSPRRLSILLLSSAVALPACALADDDVADNVRNLDEEPVEPGVAEPIDEEDPEQPAQPGDACGAVELHVVGIYDSYEHSLDKNGFAHVHIDRPGTMMLALSAYSATKWSVTVGPDTELLQILAQGYDEQSVSAPPGVSVSTNWYPNNLYPLCGYQLPDDDDGCATGPLLAQISDTLGLPVSSFHGCYAASDFTIAADLSSTSNCATGLGYTHSAVNLCGVPGDPGDPGEPSEPSEPSDAAQRACAGAEGLGVYRGYFCEPEHNFIHTADILCVGAYENCELNKQSNPSKSLSCTWNDKQIYVHENDEGVCAGVPSGNADIDP